jgi:putative ABC transport system ATP-binding protein
MNIDIKVKNIKKIYPGKVPTYALRGISFEITEGEFVAIMGKSGSGKSTMLHQLGLLDSPTEGEIIIDDVDVSKLSDREKTLFRLQRLGYVFQEYALIIELTALENVLLPAFALNGSHQSYKERAIEMLDKVGLKERVDHRPNELSGGEQQRVAIARALINNPKILFADEPTANLDTNSSREILELFKKLNKEMGQTIVLVTHEPDDRKYVDRVLWFKDGLLEKEETTHQHISI